MKRILCFFLALFLLLPLATACGTDDTTVKVGVLSGTTGMGAVKMIEEGDERFSVEIYSATNPQALLTDLTAGTVDLAAIPTNAAAKLYNATGGKIRMLALNTLGVLYLLDTTGEIETLADLEGKEIYIPMPGQNPEYILRHILAENGIEANVKTDIADADMLATALLSNAAQHADVTIAVLPQPKVTVVKNQAAQQGKALTVALDLSAEWDKIEDTPIAQGCLVGRADFVDKNPALVLEFLRSYKASVEFVADPENLDEAANLIVSCGIIPKAPIAKAALPYCGISYLAGRDMRATLTAFYGVLFEFAPASIGGKLPLADFYYGAD